MHLWTPYLNYWTATLYSNLLQFHAIQYSKHRHLPEGDSTARLCLHNVYQTVGQDLPLSWDMRKKFITCTSLGNQYVLLCHSINVNCHFLSLESLLTLAYFKAKGHCVIWAGPGKAWHADDSISPKEFHNDLVPQWEWPTLDILKQFSTQNINYS